MAKSIFRQKMSYHVRQQQQQQQQRDDDRGNLSWRGQQWLISWFTFSKKRIFVMIPPFLRFYQKLAQVLLPGYIVLRTKE